MQDIRNKVTVAITIIMVGIILTGAVLFLCTDFLIERLREPNRTYTGWLFLVYGIYRGWRLYKQIRDKA